MPETTSIMTAHLRSPNPTGISTETETGVQSKSPVYPQDLANQATDPPRPEVTLNSIHKTLYSCEGNEKTEHTVEIIVVYMLNGDEDDLPLFTSDKHTLWQEGKASVEGGPKLKDVQDKSEQDKEKEFLKAEEEHLKGRVEIEEAELKDERKNWDVQRKKIVRENNNKICLNTDDISSLASPNTKPLAVGSSKKNREMRRAGEVGHSRASPVPGLRDKQNEKRKEGGENMTEEDNEQGALEEIIPTEASENTSTQAPKINWLSDSNMLSNLIPEARVRSVGYDLRSTSGDTPVNLDVAALDLRRYISQEAPGSSLRPIILIGHAYGGVVIEKALTQESISGSPKKPMLSAIAGLILLVTPFEGSNALPEPLVLARELQAIHEAFDVEVLQKEAYEYLGPDDTEKKRGDKKKWSMRRRKEEEKKCRRNVALKKYSEHSDRVPFLSLIDSQISPRVELDDSDLAKIRGQHGTENVDSPKYRRKLSRDLNDTMNFASSLESHFKVVSEFIRGALDTQPLLKAAARDDTKTMTSLIDQGVNINLKGHGGQTALHVAIKKGASENMIHLLLGLGDADITVRDDRGMTALHLAVERNESVIVESLLDKQANVTAGNNDGKTPEDLATESSDRRKIAEMLNQVSRELVQGPLMVPTSISTPLPPSSKLGRQACMQSYLTAAEICDFPGSDRHWSVKCSVFDMVYGRDTFDAILDKARPSNITEAVICRWLHIPANNMTWVQDLFAKFKIDASVWTGQGYNDQVPYGRCINPHAATLHSYSPDPRATIFAIFLPFLSYEMNTRQSQVSQYIKTIKSTKKEQELPLIIPGGLRREYMEFLDREVRRQTSTARYRDKIIDPSIKDKDTATALSTPRLETLRDPQSDSGSEPQELRNVDKWLIGTYFNYKLPLHVRRTLDQYYYHMISNTDGRDKDQVMSRWARRTFKDEREHNILMVDQLWLWIIRYKEGPDLVISSFPDREGVNPKYIDKLERSVLNKEREPITCTADLVSRIVAVCSNELDRCQDDELLQFLPCFESSIARVGDEEVKLFDLFRTNSENLSKLSGSHEHDQERAGILEKLLDIKKGTSLLVEIKDILDEIKIIESVLGAQRSVINGIDLRKFESKMSKKGSARDFDRDFADARRIIDGFIADFERMKEHARTIYSSVETRPRQIIDISGTDFDQLNHLLDLKQKQANAWEARAANEAARASAKQGSVMLAFTMVTIIFLPLSFMSSFFALDVGAFPTDPAGKISWPLHTVSGYIFGISFAVAIPFIAAALNVNSLTALWSVLEYTSATLTLAIIRNSSLFRGKKFDKVAKQCSKRLERYTDDHPVQEKASSRIDRISESIGQKIRTMTRRKRQEPDEENHA